MGKYEKKNLIYLFADQWRASAVGFEKEEPVYTPNIDEFCEEATKCDHAFSTFPLCSPHRASLLTGKYPLSLNFFTNCKTGLSMRLMDEEIGIGEVLKEHGYQTAYIGKWHLDEPEENHSFMPLSGARVWDAFTPPGVRRHGFDYWYSYGACDEHMSPHYWMDTPKSEQVHQWSAEHETDKAIEYLKVKRAKEKPFALYLSWNPPHSPYDQVPEKYLSIYRNKDISLRRNVEFENLHHHTGETVPYRKDDLVLATKQYYAAVSGLDDQFGRLVQFLKAEGLYDNTIIVLSSDHGDMLGSHGLMGKHVWYEEALRIPFIIRIPGNRKNICHTCMASQDIMPTLLALLDLPIPKGVEGEDSSIYLTEGVEDLERVSFICACPGREILIKKFQDCGLNPANYGWRGVRSQNYTYVMEIGYDTDVNKKRYLYHTAKDPYQMQPVDFMSVNYYVQVRKYEQMVVEWMRKQNDGFLEIWEA